MNRKIGQAKAKKTTNPENHYLFNLKDKKNWNI